ncbi:hypothetical protein BXY39_2102 [Eilatimonas milleporae]|uniref:Uncharacterized protein n=1 Tax=Eilatimonas milleporae TaxID=911205 RepID=A0A3M0CGU0_9PROT|nr:hypothetical protein BXY39_2102 [Eilatimonas milleporae]
MPKQAQATMGHFKGFTYLSIGHFDLEFIIKYFIYLNYIKFFIYQKIRSRKQRHRQDSNRRCTPGHQGAETGERQFGALSGRRTADTSPESYGSL